MSVASGRGEAGVHRAAQRRVLPQGAAPDRGPLVTLSHYLNYLHYPHIHVCTRSPELHGLLDSAIREANTLLVQETGRPLPLGQYEYYAANNGTS